MQVSFDDSFYDVKIALNVPRDQAEYLYDEIEGLLAICFENIMSRRNGVPIERIASVTALTGYLVEKLENPHIVVNEVASFRDPLKFTTQIGVRITVPNLWAMKFGTEVDGLDETLEYLKNPPVEKPAAVTSSTQMAPLINGQPVSPIIGQLAYDQLTNQMKLWDGVNWVAAA